MKLTSSIVLATLGAILAFAVDGTLFPYFDLKVVGFILMASGIIGLVAVVATNRPKRTHRVTESRSILDPGTGESIVRNETRDSAL